MNDIHLVPSGRGAPNADTNMTNTETLNISMTRSPGVLSYVEEIQVPRSPQPLSLQIDGLNAHVYDKDTSNSVVESSEHGSETSGDGQRQDLQSTSTFTDSVNSLPLSSLNTQPMEFVNSFNENVNTHNSTTYKQSPEFQEPSPGLVLSHKSNLNGHVRRRSKSTGLSAHDSKIAQLSARMRTRLSKAAANLEKSRSNDINSQLALHGLASFSSAVQPANSTILTPPVNPRRTSPSNIPRSFLSHHRSQSAIPASDRLSNFPKLAPPVDIIASNGDTYLRANSNLIKNSYGRSPYSGHSPYFRHRRNNSHQEPPNARAEQDAIETLMFMSSPENSGYRASPRPLQPPTQRNLHASIYSDRNGSGTDQNQHSQNDRLQSGEASHMRNSDLGLEAHAGDEIDRILDQMGSDSEEDAHYASHRFPFKLSAPGGHSQPK
ncbi:hypothetical protein N7495_003998 [Penicillium taxi]|uniref:uncharacterized protein n=1 Tax=Penicillium taxi TaxID=168475 RepID=UPI0025451EDB|nr:uncharacterized protein N7495_003998 [Penicillium taxi]KAJ5899254.1 hypothetical protein N7495_003998 [Penicillium taxi]